MYAVNLQVSARKHEQYGLYANEDVAKYVASQLRGYDDGTNGPVHGVVSTVEVDMSPSVENYQASQQAAKELDERATWAKFYENLSDTERALMSKYAPASIGV